MAPILTSCDEANVCSYTVASVDLTPEGVERLRRSLAMLRRGQPALDREKAMAVLEHVQEVEDRLTKLLSELRRIIDSYR